MKKNRPGVALEKLCAGPGNLTRALGLDLSLNDTGIATGRLGVYDDGFLLQKVVVTGRIGISQARELPLRFYLAGNPSVSRT